MVLIFANRLEKMEFLLFNAAKFEQSFELHLTFAMTQLFCKLNLNEWKELRDRLEMVVT
jgi:hypothetical protein